MDSLQTERKGTINHTKERETDRQTKQLIKLQTKTERTVNHTEERALKKIITLQREREKNLTTLQGEREREKS